MKNKQITISVIAITLIAVLLFAFASCNKNKNVIEGYSAEVFDTYVEIYFDDELVQKAEYPQDASTTFNLDYAKEHIEFVDADFDGNKDLCLAVNAKGSAISYYCWLYDAKTKQFVFSDELSKLKTISLNEEKHQIISLETKKGKDVYVCYEWVDGKLTKVKSIDADSPDLPVEIKDAVQNNSIGVKTDDSTKSRSEISSSENQTTASAGDNTTKNNNSEKQTTSSSGETSTTEKSGNKETTKKKTPSTTSGQSSEETGVVLVTGSINDGWF